jgi:hypothetical protein
MPKNLEQIVHHFGCHHHFNYGVNTINSFDKEMLASTFVSLLVDGVDCSEIRQSLNGYYYFEIVNPVNHYHQPKAKP